MNADDFENQLRDQTFREVPPAWRKKILQAANSAVPASTARIATSAVTAAPGVPWWRTWLWPCPQAWAGLAVVWVVSLTMSAMDSSTRGQGPGGNLASGQSAEPEPALAEQRRELARLLDLNPSEPKPAPKSAPGPRSEGRSPSKV